MILSTYTDNVNEVEVQNAVMEGFKNLIPYGSFLHEYTITSYPDTHTIPVHYVIYWRMLPNNTRFPQRSVSPRKSLREWNF